MTKLTLNDVSSFQNDSSAVNTVNNNSDAIVAAVENTLSRDGTSPNTMGATLDMNSNRIVNLPLPISATEPLRVADADTLNGGGTITLGNLPGGGTTGQALVKLSNTSQDAGWASTHYIPAGGVTGQPLAKNSNTDYDVSYQGTNGTGNFVKDTNATMTSPVFTTPALGTPTTGNLSNCTNYPFNSVTGTNSGIATYLSTNAGPILGVTDGSNAAAGMIGEYVEGNFPIGSSTSVPTDTNKTFAQLTLTPGDWDVSATAVVNPNGSNTLTEIHVGISSTNNVLQGLPGGAPHAVHCAFQDGQASIWPTGTARWNITTTTTLYAVVNLKYTTGSTMTVYGCIRARRMR